MNEPLKVVHVVWLSGIGGGELFALELIRALERRPNAESVEQQLFYLGPGGPLREAIENLGVPATQFEKRTKLGAVTLWRLARALRRAAPDVLQVHGEAGVLWGLTAALLAGKRARVSRPAPAPDRVALIYQYGANTRLKWAATRWLLQRATRVLCGSEAVLRWTVSRVPALAGKTFVGYCGIDTAPFRQVAAERRGRQPSDAGGQTESEATGEINPGPVRIFACGRLVEAKGHAVLLDAVRLLADRGIPVQATIAGDGERRESLEAQARRLGITEQVEFLGTVWPLTGLLAEADLFVFPSLMEAQGLAPIEALAAEVPVIATTAGGPAEMLVDAENALLVPPGDAAALASAIERAWGDPALRARLATSGARTAAEYDIEPIAESFLRHYREIREIP